MKETRKLAAVMFTDVVGYSAMMSKNEKLAMSILEKNREIHKSAIEGFRGEYIKEIGDGTLSIFQSSFDAVSCAIEIHKACCKESSFQIRIGIHIGDIIVKEGDVFGDGVNIASRIEASGEPGGIYISERVNEDIENKTEIKTKFIGEKTLKNISHPVKIYTLLSEPFPERQTESTATSMDKVKGKSIAVLPFTDMSQQKDQEYFCEGMAEELINALTKVTRLQVASRTSAFQFKGKGYDISEIGKKLNVQSVLEGSIRKSGNKLRITAQLVNVSDGYHLWSEKYDRDMEDIFAIQDEISLKIVENLKVKLLEKDKAKLLRRYTENQEAYDLYLKGRYFWNRRYEGGLQKAIENFNQTIKKDSSYAPAYSGIADSLSILGLFWLPPRDVFPRAKSAAQKAIEIDETLAEGHASLGWILFMYDWDWTAAEREFKRAIELDPRYALNHMWYAILLSQMGRFEEAMVHSKRALEIEPVSLIINACSALVLWNNRQYGEAIKQGVKAVEMDPNFLLSYWYLSLGYNGKGMWKECLAALEKAVALSGDSTFFLGAIGHAYANSGQKKKAQKILCRLKKLSKTKYNSPINEALIFLGLEEKDQMFEYLEKAYNERSFMITSLKVAPVFDSVRPDPRYLELLKKLGLEK